MDDKEKFLDTPLIIEKQRYSKKIFLRRLIDLLLTIVVYVFIHILFVALLFTVYQQIVRNNDYQLFDLYLSVLHSNSVIMIGILLCFFNFFILSDY
ncbi:hypothetical protein VZ99_11125 [Streptococcus agalactiae]|uniref:hypothetical protein n=1 Tax=Streptococcus agalactiae TaxID=1311 RepID=UPI0006408661|nr:hypothetical protein [Streptococcus agalactiae]KLL28254.1 hypothetical protein WA00_07810 [Streptococcus agalactiae]KLL33345.1 hypothetical protein WA00_01500 [Streptococcus agalactiae]KLL91807.1 hypothetical protein VZ99_11125 [Streptococcus agalactiae]